MADVRPFRAVRYSPDVDLSAAVCPPFDTISPEHQARLYDLGAHNAVRLELPTGDGDRYESAAGTLGQWLAEGTLARDETPAFYVYRQEFPRGGVRLQRTALFGRLRLEPWERQVVLPHEQTFRAPKQDRLDLLRALRLNTSPIFLLYPDAHRAVAPLLTEAKEGHSAARFDDESGSSHALWRVDDRERIEAISVALTGQRLYIADGHHRYETALAYRDEVLGESAGDEPERFALVALVAADDPGLLVLPIHRLVKSGAPLQRVLDTLMPLFEVETRPSLGALLHDLTERGRVANSFGLIAAEAPDLYLLTLLDPAAAAPHLPSERSAAWHRLDYAIANHIILRYAMDLSDAQMEDIETVWFVEEAEEALAEVREGGAGYAVLLNPVSPRQIMAVADAGERMPQKSTFFYPKIPTGLVFHPLF